MGCLLRAAGHAFPLRATEARVRGSLRGGGPGRSRGSRGGSGGWGLLAAALLAAVPAPGAAQLPLTVELRAGAVYSTPFARGRTLVPAELEAVARDLEVGPRPGPVVELALSGRPGPTVALELRSGASVAGVAGRGGGFSWDAGRVTALHLVGGVRFRPPRLPELDLRFGAGKVFYLSRGVNLLDEREHTGVLLSAGFGYRLPGPLPWTGLAEVQRHEFDPVPLAGTGAGSGAVTRVVAQVAVAVWGRS